MKPLTAQSLQLFMEPKDWTHLRTIVAAACEQSPGPADDVLRQVLARLPTSLLAEALQWGFRDTCVRDNVYTELREAIEDHGTFEAWLARPIPRV
jgi:hypothetical protein